MTDKIVVMTTCATLEEAERIARKLVEERLAACVNVIAGAKSFYRWQGAIENSSECLVIIKSSRNLFESLSTELEKAHSYDLPEIIAIPIVEGSPNYLNWMERELRKTDWPGPPGTPLLAT